MKREIPLFIFDTSRLHKMGECDFVTCTDVDNGFVAKIDYVEGDVTYNDYNIKIVPSGRGISARIEIKRFIGKNTNKSQVNTLLNKAMKMYSERTQREMDTDNPTTENCIDFIDLLIRGNLKNIEEAGIDQNKRNIVINSIKMLENIKKKLEDYGKE
jgi:hypothetical protein